MSFRRSTSLIAAALAILLLGDCKPLAGVLQPVKSSRGTAAGTGKVRVAVDVSSVSNAS